MAGAARQPRTARRPGWLPAYVGRPTVSDPGRPVSTAGSPPIVERVDRGGHHLDEPAPSTGRAGGAARGRPPARATCWASRWCARRARSCSTWSRRYAGSAAATSSADLAALLEDVDLDTAARLVRAFGTYFHLANVTEQVHRAREMRVERAGKGGWLAQTAERIRAAGMPTAEVAALVERIAVRPVFTAHPTEAARRSILSKRRRVAELLERAGRPAGRPPDRRGHRPAVADRRAAAGPAGAAGRGAQRGVLPGRADAAHGGRRARGARRPARVAGRRAAAGEPAADLRQLDRRRPRRQPERHAAGHHRRAGAAARARAARPRRAGRRPDAGPVVVRAAGRREPASCWPASSATSRRCRTSTRACAGSTPTSRTG